MPNTETVPAKVVRIDRDTGIATVIVDAASICPRCAAGKGCGAGLFSGGGEREIDAEVHLGSSISEGDEVGLKLASRDLLQAALVVYGWPLAGAVLAVLGGSALAFTDTAIAVLALLGLGAGFLAARRYLEPGTCTSRYTPVLTDLPGPGSR